MVCFLGLVITCLSSVLLLARNYTVSLLNIAVCMLHIALIINSISALYLKKDAHEVYFMIMCTYVTVFVLNTISFLQLYKKHKESQIILTNSKVKYLEILIILSVFSIVFNVLLRDKSIVYLLNIVLSMLMTVSIIII